MNTTAEPSGSLDIAIAHATRLLRSNPDVAAEQAVEILKVAPNHPMAMLLLGVARRLTGHVDAALELLLPLAASQPRWAVAHYELGLAQGDASQIHAALASLRRAVYLRPNMPDAWRTIGDHLLFQRRCPGRRCGLRAAHQGVDAGPAAPGRRLGVGGRQNPGSRGAAARPI